VFIIQRKLPEYGWSDLRIELLLQELALMDSNNFPGKEGRLSFDRVQGRHAVRLEIMCSV